MSKGEGGVNAPTQTVLSREIVEAVASAEGVPPAELAPPEYEALHEVVDPEALDALFADRHDNTPRPSGTVSFTYCGYHVTVDSDGAIELD